MEERGEWPGGCEISQGGSDGGGLPRGLGSPLVQPGLPFQRRERAKTRTARPNPSHPGVL